MRHDDFLVPNDFEVILKCLKRTALIWIIPGRRVLIGLDLCTYSLVYIKLSQYIDLFHLLSDP